MYGVLHDCIFGNKCIFTSSSSSSCCCCCCCLCLCFLLLLLLCWYTAENFPSSLRRQRLWISKPVVNDRKNAWVYRRPTLSIFLLPVTEVTRDFPQLYSEFQGITKQRFVAQASLQTKFIPNPKKKKFAKNLSHSKPRHPPKQISSPKEQIPSFIAAVRGITPPSPHPRQQMR